MEADNMKTQDLKKKLDMISENIWKFQQRNGNDIKKIEILEKKSTVSDRKNLLHHLHDRLETT